MSDILSNENRVNAINAASVHNLKDGVFNCPFCHALQAAYDAISMHSFSYSNGLLHTVVYVTCHVCGETSICLVSSYHPIVGDKIDFNSTEFAEQLLFPTDGSKDAPSLNPDMPTDAAKTYKEAADILDKSPRSAVALLRLALQQLVDSLIIGSGNLDTKIGKLVQNGLSVRIQQMLDSIRVIGNNAVHPGQIDLSDHDDAKHIALSLFSMINAIVQSEITDQHSLDEIYKMIPDGQKQHIDQRDSH
ncbi:hypothetical protein Nizo2814_1799 [Lactiplantibacillus plantarum]|uniref:DUF4145 domain-containing protein n=1 Tax=Lactiplantibacillus plantarum TaxID=1590 RepID=UPI0007B54FF7|nr:DUF4145 domain-containing protein [Lactiplantibacillus plantarum]KZU62670.1 hypothetical protein Nizo2814_1799 [Lactiplantibacillus plantarum]